MIPTIEYVQQKFREFNVTMFDGRLPEPPISITNAKTYLGVVVLIGQYVCPVISDETL